MGNKEKLNAVLKNAKIIHREEFGETLKAAIFEEKDKTFKQNLRNEGFQISALPLQKLFVYITEGD